MEFTKVSVDLSGITEINNVDEKTFEVCYEGVLCQ